VKYAQIKQWQDDYPVATMCQAFDVSLSGYYAWYDRPLSNRAIQNARLELEIKAAHQRTRQTFGSERLHQDLVDHGIRVGLSRVRRIRKKLNLRCKQKRKFRITTDSKHNLPIAPNLIARHFKVEAPNQVWVSDITYIPTQEGWLYLAGIKDLFNGEIVGYAMHERMTKDLVITALFQAQSHKRPAKGLIYHSDRGSQYCAHEFKRHLDQFGMQASMSRKGDCWDNAPMESFWGTLKNELVHHRRYKTRQEAMEDIKEYIEIFYNRQRKQARLGYLSPADYLKNYYALKTKIA